MPLLERGKNKLALGKLRGEDYGQFLEASRSIDESMHQQGVAVSVTGSEVRRHDKVRPWRVRPGRVARRLHHTRHAILENPTFRSAYMQVHRVGEPVSPYSSRFRILVGDRISHHDYPEMAVFWAGDAIDRGSVS